MKMVIYNLSQQIASTPNTDAKKAWKSARQYVRTIAHADGADTPETIAMTWNRPFVERGIYRALPEKAMARRTSSYRFWDIFQR